MNTAKTNNVQLSPPPFQDGLQVWSSTDGTPGSNSYHNASNAALVPADQDFGSCLEMLKTTGEQHLRYMGKTPISPGRYLKITARLKAISGNFPSVRIAGWAGATGDVNLPWVTQVGPLTELKNYGNVVEVTAIVGSGQRPEVDMVWGTTALYGHFGLDLKGKNGGLIRIDDLVIEDVTELYFQDLLKHVDVRDYGALGDGTTDDRSAFVAADAAAAGREILVPSGSYFIGRSLTLHAPVSFEGTLNMAETSVLSLTKQFDLPTYIRAFGDEERGFVKAFQSLLSDSDHESLDMAGRRVTINRPLDMARLSGRTSFAQRRVIRNGQLYAAGDSVWNSAKVTSQGSYSTYYQTRLSNVKNVVNIQVGSLVEGVGVGREVYVRAVDLSAQQVTLSQPLYAAEGTQEYTFTRFQYLLDFSGFGSLHKMCFSDIEFQCNVKANAIMLPQTGWLFQLRDCYVTRPRHRAITSIGTGCQGMLIDNCFFHTAENNKNAQDRESIVLNTNGNDVKLRNNWASQFRHFAVMSGSYNVISGNHIYQGDAVKDGLRLAGIVLAQANISTTIVGNYIDNCSLEWTNEHDATPDYNLGFGFLALSVTNNMFLCGDTADWFSYIVLKPYGTGHSISGLDISGNTFWVVNGKIDRVERVDTSFADIDYSKLHDIQIAGNSFHNIKAHVTNPVIKNHRQNSLDSTWRVNFDGALPFKGHARAVTSVVVTGTLKNGSNVTRYTSPSVQTSGGLRKMNLCCGGMNGWLAQSRSRRGSIIEWSILTRLQGCIPRRDELSLSDATAPLRWRP